MAWDDEPPPVSSWDSAPPTSDELEGKSVGGFVKNIGTDIADTAKGIGTLAKGLVTHPIDTAVSTAKALPGAIVEEGKRIGVGELLTGNFGNAVSKFGNALYDKPLTTALDVIPAAGAAGKGIKAWRGGKSAAKAGTLAETAAPVADDLGHITSSIDDAVKTGASREIPVREPLAGSAPPPVSYTPPSASAPPPAAPAAPTGVPGVVDDVVSHLGEKAKTAVKGPLDEVHDFLSQKYGKFNETPGAMENFGKALQQKGRGMELKEIGGTPGMMRTLRDRFGEDYIEALADLSGEKGITKGFFNFQTGNAIKKLSDESGRAIGALREMAVNRGATHNVEELIKAIRAELDPLYMSGAGSTQKGTYLKALQDIRRSAPDAKSLAETLTEKNRFIKKNRITQPLGAASDVYNAASRLNNELIVGKLNPMEAHLYQASLRDFASSRVFDKMYGITYGRDMAGRSGPSSPINYLKDIGGRKIMQKVFSNVGRRMQKSPGEMRSTRALTTEVLESIEDSIDEIIEAMGKGEAPPQ